MRQASDRIVPPRLGSIFQTWRTDDRGHIRPVQKRCCGGSARAIETHRTDGGGTRAAVTGRPARTGTFLLELGFRSIRRATDNGYFDRGEVDDPLWSSQLESPKAV